MIHHSSDLIKYASAIEHKSRLIIAGSDETDVVKTVVSAVEAGLVDATMVGHKEEILHIADTEKLDISNIEIVDESDRLLCIEKSLELIRDGHGDILMKGQVMTGDLMKKVMDRAYGLRTDRILSHVAVFSAPGEDRLTLITDAGINISPDLTRKRDIILNAVDVAHALGIAVPKVAVLSYIEKVKYSSVRSTMDASLLAGMNRDGDIPGCIVEGPYALDNAISMEAAKMKGINGRVAGQADVLVTHDINMGNAIYKALQVWVKVTLAGIVVGSNSPIVVPSRADSKESKLMAISLAIIVNNYMKSMDEQE